MNVSSTFLGAAINAEGFQARLMEFEQFERKLEVKGSHTFFRAMVKESAHHL